MGLRCSLAADVYSLGLILVDLCTRNTAGGRARGGLRLPRAPDDCPQARVAVLRGVLGSGHCGPAVPPCGCPQLLSFTAASGIVLPSGPARPQAVVELISECLSPDPGARPAAADVLRRLREDG